MVRHYHPQITFEDPAFGVLQGEHARNMWRMLCASQQGKDFKVEYSEIRFVNNLGEAKWEARYTFSPTGRLVHNKIRAQFNFRDGKIISHTDDFDLHRWASQAMGWKGSLIGWTGFFRKKLQKQTHKMLCRFEENTMSSGE